MNYWIVVLSNKQAAEWVLDHERMAFRDARRAGALRLQAGDWAAVYLSTRATRSHPSVVALCQFTSDLVRAPVKIADETFPLTCEWRVEKRLPFDQGVDFSELVPSLGFIEKKRGWQFYLMTSPRRVPRDDFKQLERAVAERHRLQR